MAFHLIFGPFVNGLFHALKNIHLGYLPKPHKAATGDYQAVVQLPYILWKVVDGYAKLESLRKEVSYQHLD